MAPKCICSSITPQQCVLIVSENLIFWFMTMALCEASPVWSCLSRRHPFGMLLIPTGRIKIFGKPLKGKKVLQGRTSPALVPQPWIFSESYFVENINFLLTTSSLRKCLKRVSQGCCSDWWGFAGAVLRSSCWTQGCLHGRAAFGTVFRDRQGFYSAEGV